MDMAKDKFQGMTFQKYMIKVLLEKTDRETPGLPLGRLLVNKIIWKYSKTMLITAINKHRPSTILMSIKAKMRKNLDVKLLTTKCMSGATIDAVNWVLV